MQLTISYQATETAPIFFVSWENIYLRQKYIHIYIIVNAN